MLPEVQKRVSHMEVIYRGRFEPNDLIGCTVVVWSVYYALTLTRIRKAGRCRLRTGRNYRGRLGGINCRRAPIFDTIANSIGHLFE